MHFSKHQQPILPLYNLTINSSKDSPSSLMANGVFAESAICMFHADSKYNNLHIPRHLPTFSSGVNAVPVGQEEEANNLTN